MLTAYIDESGQDSHDWMSMAGFIGNDDQWRDVPRLWRDAIAPRRHLHMKELRFNSRKQRIQRTLERAATVPNECGLTGMFGAVRFADYADLVKNEERLFCGYVACCFPMVLNTLRGIPKHESVELVFERQDRYWPLLEQALAAVVYMAGEETRLPNGISKLANWGFVEKYSTPLTEPADYLAYSLVRNYRDPSSLRAKWCKPLMACRGGKGYGRRLSRQKIRTIIAKTQMLYQLSDDLPKLMRGDIEEVRFRVPKI